MYALTLWPEWIWAMVWLGKRVENRKWRPPSWIIGKRIALHAGKYIGGRKGGLHFNEDAMTDVCLMAETDNWETHIGNKFGQLELSKNNSQLHFHEDSIVTSAIVFTAVITGYDYDEERPWSVPELCHWHLEEVEILDQPVPCGGHQKLWEVPKGLLPRYE